MISACVTVAPVGGTSPEPREAGSRGAVPHSYHPHPGCFRPTVLPLEPVFSLLRRLPFLRRTKLPFSAPCPFRGPLLSFRELSLQFNPGVSTYSPLAPAPLKFPSTTPPNTAEAPGPSRDPPGSPGLGAVGEGGPTLHPLHLFLGLGPDRAGLRLRRGAGGGSPSGRRASPGRRGERTQSKGARQGSGSGSLAPRRRRNPRLPPPRLRRGSSGNR